MSEGKGGGFELEDPRDLRAAALLERAVAGFGNVSTDGEGQLRRPANRWQSLRARWLVLSARLARPRHELVCARLQEITGVLQALPGPRLLVPAAICVLLAAGGWWLQELHAASERLGAAAAARPLRLARDADLLPSLAKDARPLTRLPKGQTVTVLGVEKRSHLHVRHSSGDVGFVELGVLEGGDRLVAARETGLLAAEPGRGKAARDAPRLPVPAGAVGTLLDCREDHVCRVRLDSGVLGWTTLGAQGLDRALLAELPRRNPSFAQAVSVAVLEGLVGKGPEDVEKALGLPTGLFVRGGQGRVLYDGALTVVAGVRRHEGAELQLEGGRVARVSPSPVSEVAWSEQLPLAGAVRAVLARGPLAPPRLLAPEASGLFAPLRLRGPVWAVAVRVVETVLGGLLILYWVPLALSALVRAGLLRLRLLSNRAAFWSSFAVHLLAIYAWFLVLAQVVALRQSSGPVLLVVLLLVMLLGLRAGVTVIRGDLRMHRCPSCHRYPSAADLGSTVLGTTRAYEWVERQQFTHETRELGHDEQYRPRYVITRHYRRHWDLRETERDEVEDERECVFCGERWTVERWEYRTRTHQIA